MTKPSALIVEDDPHISDIFSRTLSPNFNVVVYHDGSSALDHLEKDVPDLVLLDLHLPIISGETVLNYLCLDPRLADTKVIIISADFLRAERLQHRVDATLYKPISLNQLREVISLMQLRGKVTRNETKFGRGWAQTGPGLVLSDA